MPAGHLVTGGIRKELSWNKMVNLCVDKVGKDVTLSVKNSSVLGVSYSQFATSKRGKIFLFYKWKELLSFLTHRTWGRSLTALPPASSSPLILLPWNCSEATKSREVAVLHRGPPCKTLKPGTGSAKAHM